MLLNGEHLPLSSLLFSDFYSANHAEELCSIFLDKVAERFVPLIFGRVMELEERCYYLVLGLHDERRQFGAVALLSGHPVLRPGYSSGRNTRTVHNQ